MKKFLVLCICIVSFFGIHTVKADTEIYNYEYMLESYSDTGLSEKQLLQLLQNETEINKVKDYWEKNLKSDYPYYFYGINSNVIGERIDLIFMCFKGIPFYDSLSLSRSIGRTNSVGIVHSLKCSSTCYELQKVESSTWYYNSPLYYWPEKKERGYLPFIYYDSNFNYIFNLDQTANIVKDEQVIYTLNKGDIIPTYKNLFNVSVNNYVEVNLNNYAYIALSLKDYTKEISNSYSEYSNIYVKGQLCATPVYNYGQTERKDILTGSKVQACSLYNSDYALTRFYILPSDIKNHAIYYLKAYDTTKDNYVKIDTSYFDITYITEENKDNPQVSIDGKIYPTLSYDKLTDTSTKSEDEGYVSGVSCAVGDFNCYSEYNPSNVFKDIFDKPLEALKSVWSAIINVFELIKMFIMLLPQTLQSFLYLSFMIAIVLGIIKIIL